MVVNANMSYDQNPLKGTMQSLADVTLTATTAPGTALSATSIPCKAVIVEALHGNAGLVRVADKTNVSQSRGDELGPGETIVIPVTDVSTLGGVSTNGTDKVGVDYLV